MPTICNDPTCNKNANFNFAEETRAIYCSKHKLVDMVDIVNKRCFDPECDKRPIYNYPTETRAKFCNKHKLVDMVDIIHKRCEIPECDTRPFYNFAGETSGKYCVKHKLVDMVDIKNKKCEYDKCDKQPSYNYPNETRAKFCSKHKLPNMVDIKSKRCHSNFCDTFVRKNINDGYCLPCFINIFPDRPVTRNYKTKEKNVADFVLENFNNLTIITDKKVQDGCSKRRPDLIIDLGYQVLIIEVDENQHIGYDCYCETKRINDLSQDVGHRPIIFIRFNPDDYKDKNNNNVTSCFGINGTSGILQIKKSKQKEWNDRLNSLKNVIDYWINPSNTTNKLVEIIQLFYDENL